MAPRNLLFIVVDQFRADLLHGPLSKVAPTPNIDRLAGQSQWYRNHHTVVVPCGPARASLLTGQYVSNHKSAQNGSPLGAYHPTLASELRKLGREPLLFGYTDTQPDPAGRAPLDPAHRSYTAPMPGFTEVVEMREECWLWLAHLRQQGYDVPDAEALDFHRLYQPQGGVLGGAALYRAEHSDTAFLTDQTIAHLDVRKSHPWSALVTYIRPHPPFVAPAPYHSMVAPVSIPAAWPQPADHPFFEAFHALRTGQMMYWGFTGDQRAITPEITALVRAAYLGLVAELDAHIGRLLDWLDDAGQAEETLVVLTADHGEMLGDFGMWGKQTPFRAASHVPLMLRGPGIAPGVIDEPSESIDVMPTILGQFEAQIPATVDGRALGPDLPPRAARIELELAGATPNRFAKEAGQGRASALETGDWRLVQFANGMAPMLFDLRKGGEALSDDPEALHMMQDQMTRRLMADW